MSEQSPSSLPLSRYTVLDLTVARAGPSAVRLLADWGANVVRVEQPPAKGQGLVTGRRRGSDDQNLHRNKRCLCVNLKSPEGRAILKRLVSRADVVVENFRSTVKQRLGVTYEQLKEIKPDIILASISGFGQSGPYAERPGVDQIVQGMSGLMSVTGEPGRGPVRTGVAISDTTAGMFLGQGILLALLHRQHTGQGQWVHTSLLEGMLNKLDFQASRYTMEGEVAVQQGNAHPTQVPMSTFRASDGQVNIAANKPRMWTDFCKALGADTLLNDPGYQTGESRTANRARIVADVNAVTERFTVAELVERLNNAGVPCGPIYTIGEAFEDPQVKHLRMTRTATHPVLGPLQLVRSPINLSRFPYPDHFQRAAPDAGEHTVELMQEFGYDAADIEKMKQEGTIA